MEVSSCNYAPQQAHTTPTYAIQRRFQILAFSVSIWMVLWKHLDAGKYNTGISICDMFSTKILLNQGILFINSVCIFKNYPNWAKLGKT